MSTNTPPAHANVFVDQENSWTPDWARDAVWYQIFPERFRNGDPSNDPTLASIQGAWPHDGQNEPWSISPWHSDWYELQDWEKATGRDIWWNIQRRRYGGDLQGILDKLDYLQKLGINALYLTPVFMAPSLHKYDTAAYHHIDPNFGPDPVGDRALIAEENPADPKSWVWTSADKLALKLIAEVHRRGMRIIFDGVFNHVGLNHWAFLDVKSRQKKSAQREWFDIRSWDDPQVGTNFDYTGWFGVRELPQLSQDENGITEGPRSHIFDITRRWMDPDGDGDPSDGLDGWRLDVAFCVKHPFWKAWRQHVKSINPQAYVTAEVIDTPEAQIPYLAGDEFDAVMNYNFAFACSEFFVDQKNRITPQEFESRLRKLRAAYPPCVAYVMMNLYGSHDSLRIASHLVNPDQFSYRNWGDSFMKSKVQSNPDFNTRKPTTGERLAQKLFAAFQMTYVGAPMLYYGDEAGMWGANDPCCRKPMVWEDIRYDDEIYLPDQSRKPARDSVAFDRELFAHYQTLIQIRNSHPELRRGSYEILPVSGSDKVFAFLRRLGGLQCAVVINNSAEPADLTLPLSGNWTDLLESSFQATSAGGTVRLEIPAMQARILKSTL